MMATRDDDALGFFVLGCFMAIGGVAIAADQHTKRKEGEQRFRQELAQMKAELADLETKLANLQAVLGPKNEQVRILAQEVERLRRCIATGRVA
ncbi:hypothetical protein [Polyangium sp. y55x31]|uniref:hypothetical protein n=1 Tax=Polyangium sp. y55x31 TaxID=3042688 RepID=UPI0024832687|nr:hypothetical protein [Polyangium sp. y55x31]